MNRTKIEWCDYTWSPVTGCWGPGGTVEKPNRCHYCYARRMAGRFVPGDFYEGYDPFQPAFHPDRLSQPAKVKKPSKIFVCSMADLFGDWVPTSWINQIIGTAWFVAPHHTYQFLTKNPKRLKEFNPWPSNCWVGTTVTNQADADERLHLLCRVQAKVRFVSFEPLLGEIRMKPEDVWSNNAITKPLIHLGILGGMTGPGSRQHQPKPEWVQSLIDQARAAGVPIFLKDNLHWPEKIQEWPR